MKRVVVLGSLPIASKVSKALLERGDVVLEGVILCSYKSDNDPWDIEPLAQFAARNKIPVFSMNDVIKQYNENELDCAFSCRYNNIIKDPFIKRFQCGVINFHGGLLPEFGGLYSSCHTILGRSPIGGGTLHYINDETIDTGDIIDRVEFLLERDDTSLTVFKKTQQVLYESFHRNIDAIIANSVHVTPQEQLVNDGHDKCYFNIKELDKKIEVDQFDDIFTKARAFDFIGHERAYIQKDNTKVYITTTPIHHLEVEGAKPHTPVINLDVSGVDVRCKHDDLYPSIGGGNKARKIQYILKQAIESGYNALVTNGSVQSNHARATSLAATQHGIKCSLVLHAEAPDTPPLLAGNLMLMKMSGADIRFCKLQNLASAMDEEMCRLKDKGYKPFYIWGGGHCVQGSMAYYEAAKEAQKQCGGWIPEYVVHASGTGTTQAGLIAGYANLPTKVIGISVARDKERGAQVIKESLMELGEYLKEDFSDSSIDFRDDWILGGYEQTSGELFETIDQAALNGLILDPTYTGKAYMGMKHLIDNREIPQDSKVLFWHTGGLLNLLSSQEYLKRTA